MILWCITCRIRIYPLFIGLCRSLGAGMCFLPLSPNPLPFASFGVYFRVDPPKLTYICRRCLDRIKAKYLTKGDNNAADDAALYARGQSYLARKDIIGRVGAYIPMVGYVTIMLSEHPWMKTAMLGLMGLVVVLQRE